LGLNFPLSANPQVINSIIWGNTPNINFDAEASLQNSCLQGGIPIYSTDLGGNITRDPGFEDLTDFNLTMASPCLEAGIVDTTGLNLPIYDLFGNDRVQDGNGDAVSLIDMGCYESNTVTNPGFISGNISLLGGTGNIAEVMVGVGTPVHPDENGDYQFTIGASDSPYSVTAWLDGYRPVTIADIAVTAGETTNVDLELEHYQPDSYLEFTPDSLYFSTQNYLNFKFKNISQLDLNILGVSFTNSSAYYSFDPFEFLIPQQLCPNDSLACTIFVDFLLPDNRLPDNRENRYDSLYVWTDLGQFPVPIVLDGSLFSDAEDDTVEPVGYNLSNHPNPFNPSTTISFSLNTEITENTKIEIYNLKGQKVKSYPINSLPDSPINTITWNGTDQNGHPVSSGVYYYKLSTNGKTQAVNKCLLLK